MRQNKLRFKEQSSSLFLHKFRLSDFRFPASATEFNLIAKSPTTKSSSKFYSNVQQNTQRFIQLSFGCRCCVYKRKSINRDESKQQRQFAIHEIVAYASEISFVSDFANSFFTKEIKNLLPPKNPFVFSFYRQ